MHPYAQQLQEQLRTELEGNDVRAWLDEFPADIAAELIEALVDGAGKAYQLIATTPHRYVPRSVISEDIVEVNQAVLLARDAYNFEEVMGEAAAARFVDRLQYPMRNHARAIRLRVGQQGEPEGQA